MVARLEGFPLNIRILQEYLAFARVLNFSTAAREVYISQSTLSTHMKKLEDDLGVDLINHGPKPTLTHSGEVFLEYAGRIVCLFLEAIEATKQCSRETVRLTVEEPRSDEAIFEPTVRTFAHLAESHPHARLAMRSLAGHSSTKAILDDAVDIAKIVHYHDWSSPEFAEKCNEASIQCLPVAREAPCVWIQSDNPLARKERLSLADLKDTVIVVPAGVRYDDWRTLIKKWFEGAGIVPKITMQAAETITEFCMTRLDGRAFILPESAAMASLLQARNIASRTIADGRCVYHTSLAYKADSSNPLLPLYIAHMEKELRAAR